MAKVYVQRTSEKNQPGGYPGLDGASKVSQDQLPAQAGAGSIMFGQTDAALTSSRPWRSPGATTFLRATLSVEEAVTSDIDVVAILVNDVAELTLSLNTGQLISSKQVALAVLAGDLVTINRLAADGGACQVQLDQVTV
jgi:hypothetical protein